MRKLMKLFLLADMVLLLVIAGFFLADKEALSRNVVRLHVVGASDTAIDQVVKLQVRDAVTQYLEKLLAGLNSVEDVKDTINANLSNIQSAANAALEENGSTDLAVVSLCREEFPVRHYDTFSLPSGIYESLRVTIGKGEGRNWWCVVFPSLCIPASSKDVGYLAVGGGFSENLANTITGERGYKLSFFVLDCFGKLENLFHFQ